MRRLGLWSLLAALALPPTALLTAGDARASLSIAVTFDDLVTRSTSVAVVTPFEARTLWEDGRIFTYTHVHVDTRVGGKLAAGDEPWVRTMGGIVGKIGQVVDGEPVLTVGRPALLFLHEAPTGALDVTARAQGQFAIRLDDKQSPRFVQSSGAGGIVLPPPPPPGQGPAKVLPLASEILHGRPVPDATRDIAAAWSRLHGH
jgi:hypothetical protein